ncbi:non-ribosomal peptide synthetase, partial [Paenibacillus xylaniclasticus]|uniref:non-ribosomal peptide synthetase n=1 Tax=Paenibacillus xylaniclasticus TaxID=588083 RepID=UPI0013DF6B6C
NFFYAIRSYVDVRHGDTMLAETSISFDISVLELLWPITVGMAIRVSDIFDQSDKNVSIYQCTPSRLRMLLLDNNNIRLLQKIRLLLIGGERLSTDLIHQVKAATSAEIINLYGPTETTIWSTAYKVTDPSRILIGKPLNNTTIYIVDTHMNPVPIGVFGELCIGGHGVARGYLNQPQLTEERFVQSPFSSESCNRLYKTGDIGRFMADGSIEIIGRTDNQVKVRGHRIELDEVEALIMEHPAVRDVSVVLSRDELLPELQAFIVTDSQENVRRLRDDLRQYMPTYMVPAIITEVDAIPLTVSGKKDKRALHAIRRESDAVIITNEPATDIERTIARLMGALLRESVNDIGLNFFSAGGDSIKAVKLILEISRVTGKQLSLKELFQNPTIGDLA